MGNIAELRALSDDDLKVRLDEVKEELFNLRFQNGTGQLENYKRIGIVKRDIAQLRTVSRERDLGLVFEVKEVLPPKQKRRKDEEETEAPEASTPDLAETETLEPEATAPEAPATVAEVPEPEGQTQADEGDEN